MARSSIGLSHSAHLVVADRQMGGRSTFQPRSLVAHQRKRKRALQEADQDLQSQRLNELWPTYVPKSTPKNQTEPSNSPTLDDMQDNEMEWETLPNELNGDQLFLHMWFHWQRLLPDLTDALIRWKNALPMEQSSSEDDSTTNKDFDVFIIDLYTLEHTTTIHWTPDTEAAVALVRNGYIGASPQAPTLAISLKTLELYHRLHLQKPLFSYEAFTKVLCDLYNV
ncbi:hypothetical protein PC9H_011015 [Pleurotus ostreatus]|uniref:CxC1-like cysteine cluster associated with KDZ transposases domain-containing protein n=1 Tax=Pleurotus ostreatus TaxID=5322 RepID=A0A8H6ZKV2_PLEOS|nr:uncharacterized protein PC9H_011015 [Pleurotus ostreatus]KAF7422852.1 hypothetical protein PC9H_011015 [Pleurotus ostreatus]